MVFLLLSFGCANYSGCRDEVIPKKIAGNFPISLAGVYNPVPRWGPPPVLVSGCAPWLGGRVVMQRIANPSTPVRFRPEPPFEDTFASACYG